MTRLYRLDASAQEVATRFGARRGEDPWQGGYVAPEHFAWKSLTHCSMAFFCAVEP